MNTHISTAFATPGAVVAPTTFRPSSVCARRRPAPCAALNGDKRAFSTKLAGEKARGTVVKNAEYRGPQGWTAYAEKVNGRMAQLGFVIGLVTEIVSGKPIGEQILVMFSPLVAAANEITVLGAQAAHLGQHLN